MTNRAITEEALRCYPPSVAREGFPGEGDYYVNDEYGYDEAQQKAFIAGAEWALAEAETAAGRVQVRGSELTSYYGIQDWTRGREAAVAAIRALGASNE